MSALPCAGCGSPVNYKLLKRHYEENPKVYKPKPDLCCYMYDCPKCGKESSYNPQAVQMAWEEEQLKKGKV